MFFSQGIDIVENKRIENLLIKYDEKFKKKILSNDEILDINSIKSYKKEYKKYQVGLQPKRLRVKL